MNAEQDSGSKLMKHSMELGRGREMNFGDPALGWLSAAEEQFEGSPGLGQDR